MKPKNAIPKHVLAQFKAWGKLGGLARKKKLTALQRSTISSNAGKASGKARRKLNGSA